LNHENSDLKPCNILIIVNEGDRVAQLVLERICTPDVVEVEELDETERGNRGFGSTGLQ
jgi:dUTP pyrophosphatase